MSRKTYPKADTLSRKRKHEMGLPHWFISLPNAGLASRCSREPPREIENVSQESGPLVGSDAGPTDWLGPARTRAGSPGPKCRPRFRRRPGPWSHTNNRTRRRNAFSISCHDDDVDFALHLLSRPPAPIDGA